MSNPFFFRHRSLQGSQGSSTSLSSTKVSSSVEDGDGPVNEGAENSCDKNVPSVHQWEKWANITRLSHVHDLWCISLLLPSLLFWFVHHVLITLISHTFPLPGVSLHSFAYIKLQKTRHYSSLLSEWLEFMNFLLLKDETENPLKGCEWIK